MSFLKTMGSVARSGCAMVDDAELSRRLAACASCVHSSQGAAGLRCTLCGCVMSLKARFSAAECPCEHPEDLAHTRWGEPRQVEVRLFGDVGGIGGHETMAARDLDWPERQ